MQNFASCKGGFAAQKLLDSWAGAMDQALRACGKGNAAAGSPADVAADFTALFYSVLFRQMQKTVLEDEKENLFAAGMQDFLSLQFPQALARQENDPLRQYFQELIGSEFGERFNEQV